MRTYTIQPHYSAAVPASPVRDEPTVNLTHIHECSDAELARMVPGLRRALLTTRPDDIQSGEWDWNVRWVKRLIAEIEAEQARRRAANMPEVKHA